MLCIAQASQDAAQTLLTQARCAGPVLGGAFAFPCETYSSFPLCGKGQLFSKRCAPCKKVIVCLLQPLMPAATSAPGPVMLMACEVSIDRSTRETFADLKVPGRQRSVSNFHSVSTQNIGGALLWPATLLTRRARARQRVPAAVPHRVGAVAGVLAVRRARAARDAAASGGGAARSRARARLEAPLSRRRRGRGGKADWGCA